MLAQVLHRDQTILLELPQMPTILEQLDQLSRSRYNNSAGVKNVQSHLKKVQEESQFKDMLSKWLHCKKSEWCQVVIPIQAIKSKLPKNMKMSF